MITDKFFRDAKISEIRKSGNSILADALERLVEFFEKLMIHAYNFAVQTGKVDAAESIWQGLKFGHFTPGQVPIRSGRQSGGFLAGSPGQNSRARVNIFHPDTRNHGEFLEVTAKAYQKADGTWIPSYRRGFDHSARYMRELDDILEMGQSSRKGKFWIERQVEDEDWLESKVGKRARPRDDDYADMFATEGRGGVPPRPTLHYNYDPDSSEFKRFWKTHETKPTNRGLSIADLSPEDATTPGKVLDSLLDRNMLSKKMQSWCRTPLA